jgi:signal transduction histidine kinase
VTTLNRWQWWLRHGPAALRHAFDRTALGRTAQRLRGWALTPAGWDPLMTVMYVAAMLVGRSTAVAGGPSIVWPAAGVSMVWLYPHARHRWRRGWRAVALLVASTVCVNLATAASPKATAVYCVANSAMGIVSAEILRRGSNWDWYARLDTPAKLYKLFLACLGGGLASGLVGSALLRLFVTSTWMSPVEWGMRNTAGALIFGLLWYRLISHGVRVLDKPRPVVYLTVVVATVAAYLLVVGLGDDVLLFLLVPVSMATALWADVRTTVWHTITVSSVMLAITIVGHGPLMGHPPNIRALVVQCFVIVLAMVAMTIVLDREDRHRLERRLEANRLATEQHAELLDRIVHSLNEGVVLVDSMGQIGLGNAQLWAILGQPRDTPELPEAIFDGAFATPAPVNEALRTAELVTSDVVLADPDGGARIVTVTASPLVSAEGSQVVAVLRDVTEERRRTEELANFAGVVAHDLRNPLTALRGWLDALGDEVTEPMARDMLRRVEGSAVRMNVLIEDLLAYSVVRGGELATTVTNLDEICGDIADAQGDRVIDGRSPLISVAADAWVRVDPAALRQVVANLVGNSIKYSAAGRPPEVSLTLGPVRDGMQEVVVADRGIGLPAGQEAKIFEEFHRVVEHRDQYPGTGLGLAICRRIIERHGGTIAAANRADGGLQVAFTVPTAQPSSADLLALATWRQALAARRATTAPLPEVTSARATKPQADAPYP